MSAAGMSSWRTGRGCSAATTCRSSATRSPCRPRHMSALLTSASVQRVRAVLAAHGLEDRIVELAATARTAEDAARACGVPVGAIVKSLVFAVGDALVLALVAGDRRCDLAALPTALGLPGPARRCDADTVRAVTGFAIGGVAPIGHLAPASRPPSTQPRPLPAALRRRRPPPLRLCHRPRPAPDPDRRHAQRAPRRRLTPARMGPGSHWPLTCLRPGSYSSIRLPMTLAFTRRMAPETPYLMAAVLSGRRRPRQRPGAKDWLKIAHRLAAGLPPRAAALPEMGPPPRARGVPGHGRGLAGRPRGLARGPPEAPDRPRPPGAGAGAALRRRAGRRVRARRRGPRPRPGRDPRRGRAQGQGPRPAPAGRDTGETPPRPLPLGPLAAA